MKIKAVVFATHSIMLIFINEVLCKMLTFRVGWSEQCGRKMVFLQGLERNVSRCHLKFKLSI